MKRQRKVLLEDYKHLLINTALFNGRNAWEYVRSRNENDQLWVAMGICSCIKNGYGLNRLTINWEARTLRYENTIYQDEKESNRILGTKVPIQQGITTIDISDISAYTKGLFTQRDTSGGYSRREVSEESDRLIAIAKESGQFISPSEWNSFSCRIKKPSGESVVFFDDTKERVVKFKDPFAYLPLKKDNPYNALYEHHIHNHFFDGVDYQFLGVSQDPISGSVRFVFSQPFIDTIERPSKMEIHDWFTKRGFQPIEGGFFYSNGYVSFTDVWADNCLKDIEGDLRFIDPIVRFEKNPQEIITPYS